MVSAPRQATKRLAPAERRALILDSARQVFVESGYAGARTQRIAAQAEVTEALLYRYFPSKEALFEEAVLEPLEAMIAELARQTASTAATRDPEVRRDGIHAMHELVCRTCVEIVPLLGVALFSAGGATFYQERLAPLFEEAYRGAARVLQSWPLRHELDGRTGFTMTFGMYLGLALDAHLRGESLDVPDVSAQLAAMVVSGLSAPSAAGSGAGRSIAT